MTWLKQFLEKGYKENIIRNQMEEVDTLERSILSNKTNGKTEKRNSILGNI